MRGRLQSRIATAVVPIDDPWGPHPAVPPFAGFVVATPVLLSSLPSVKFRIRKSATLMNSPSGRQPSRLSVHQYSSRVIFREVYFHYKYMTCVAVTKRLCARVSCVFVRDSMEPDCKFALAVAFIVRSRPFGVGSWTSRTTKLRSICSLCLAK